MKSKVSFMDRFFYLIACLISCGIIYILKTIIVNAIVEVENNKKEG